jgi:hypothetical protein
MDPGGALVQVNTMPPLWEMETLAAFLIMAAGMAAVAGLSVLAREKGTG